MKPLFPLALCQSMLYIPLPIVSRGWLGLLVIVLFPVLQTLHLPFRVFYPLTTFFPSSLPLINATRAPPSRHSLLIYISSRPRHDTPHRHTLHIKLNMYHFRHVLRPRYRCRCCFGFFLQKQHVSLRRLRVPVNKFKSDLARVHAYLRSSHS